MNSDYVSPREPKPSEEYKELLDAYKVMHKDERAFMGISLIPLTYVIKQIFDDNKIKSFLDYGCGKGLLYTKDFKKTDKGSKYPDLKQPIQDTLGIKEFALYDPAYPEHDKLPTKKYDMVICTDVLEHIPEEDLDWVIRELCSFSQSTMFINVSTLPAKKTFKTGKYKGENVHVTVHDHKWWLNKVSEIWNDNKNLKIYLTSTSNEGIMGTCIKGE